MIDIWLLLICIDSAFINDPRSTDIYFHTLPTKHTYSTVGIKTFVLKLLRQSPIMAK